CIGHQQLAALECDRALAAALRADHRVEGGHLARDAVGRAVDGERTLAGVTDGELAAGHRPSDAIRPRTTIDGHTALRGARLADIGVDIRQARGDAPQLDRAGAAL